MKNNWNTEIIIDLWKIESVDKISAKFSVDMLDSSDTTHPSGSISSINPAQSRSQNGSDSFVPPFTGPDAEARAKKAREAEALLKKLGMASNGGDLNDMDPAKFLEVSHAARHQPDKTLSI